MKSTKFLVITLLAVAAFVAGSYQTAKALPTLPYSAGISLAQSSAADFLHDHLWPRFPRPTTAGTNCPKGTIYCCLPGTGCYCYYPSNLPPGSHCN